jgi:hypothetical protein
MILISHRGNIDGENKNKENTPNYIDNAILEGYDVEVDVWCKDGNIYTGHDSPISKIDLKWILDRCDKLWIHIKNIECLEYFKPFDEINYFWHQTDDVTLTSKGFFWTYPGKMLTRYSIAVLPEMEKFENVDIAYGICSDYIYKYKKNYDKINNFRFRWSSI